MTLKEEEEQLKTYSLQEVAKHRSRDDCWLVVHDSVYDCTPFVKNHPGGDIIVLGAGLDATIMFESYHLNPVNESVLAKYRIGKLEKKSIISYYDWTTSDFYPVLKKRVSDKLIELGRSKRGPLELHIKAFVIITTLVATWVVGFLFAGFGDLRLAAAMSILHGIAAAHVGLSIMHDGNHGSFSKKAIWNKIAGMGMDLIGASGITWEYQHVVGHHPFTNLETATETNLEHHRNLKDGNEKDDIDLKLSQENDPDVFSSFPLVRMHPRDPRYWYHKYQGVYAIALFAIFTMAKVFMSDLTFFLAGRVSHIDMHSRLGERREQFRFIFFKLLNFLGMIIIPGYLHGPLFAVGMLCLAHAVCGEYLGLAFIVNHVTDLAEFYVGGEEIGLEKADKLEDVKGLNKKVGHRDWAYCQARATANWGVESWFWNAFSGGLNHQLEHHLFPGVSHVNYPYIAATVRDTCKEYNVPYIECGSFYQAIKHMVVYLHALGQQDLPITGIEMLNAENAATKSKAE